VNYEIERKFLLPKKHFIDNLLKKVENNVESIKYIKQYYLSGEPDLRVRKVNKVNIYENANGSLLEDLSEETTITKKTGKGLKRTEETRHINNRLFNTLKFLKVGTTIHKTRYTLSTGEEIDVFDDLDLCVLEIEFYDVEKSNNVDLLFNDDILYEVTDEIEFTNFEIAQRI